MIEERNLRISRIYSPQPLSVGGGVSLQDNSAHYVARVLRLPVGALVRLFNGGGGEFTARIVTITKREVSLHIEAFKAENIGSTLSIHLGQVISRGERMDMTLQKATELGVSAITPLLSDYCNVKLDSDRLEKKMQHWQAVIISACEQSGRTIIPALYPPVLIGNWVTIVKARCRLMLEPKAELSLKELERDQDDCNITDFALLIGCEGGLSDAESAIATQHNFVGLRLGPRILRTETAALAAISALQARFGDFC